MSRWSYCCLFLLMFLPSYTWTEPQKFDGFFPQYTNRQAEIGETVLPSNPIIFLSNAQEHMIQTCKKTWPCAEIYTSFEELFNNQKSIDLLWLNHNDNEVSFLKECSFLLRQVKVIYSNSHLSGGTRCRYPELNQFLSTLGYTNLAHWYEENKDGFAVFIRSDLLDTLVRSLNCSQDENPSSIVNTSFCYQATSFEEFLKPALNKDTNHTIGNIDFIYTINLDERPEKFAHTVQALQAYNITPYRFSAVNGWKLPQKAFDQAGVQFSDHMLVKPLIGTVYREQNSISYMSCELMNKNSTSYFALGMSKGAIGIVLSHLSILQDAYTSQYKTIWVMEDDIHIMENPNILSTLVQDLYQIDPEWDILFTDLDTINPQGQRVPCRAIAPRPNFPIPPLSSFLQKFYRVSDQFSRTGMRYGAYSMLLSQSGIQKILSYYKKYSIFLPYDMDFWLIPDLKMYTPNRDIVTTFPSAETDNLKPGNWFKLTTLNAPD